MFVYASHNALFWKSQTHLVNYSINLILAEYFCNLHCGNFVDMPYWMLEALSMTWLPLIERGFTFNAVGLLFLPPYKRMYSQTSEVLSQW